ALSIQCCCYLFIFCFFFFSSYGDPRVLHSFPTRRSSDIFALAAGDGDAVGIADPVTVTVASPASGTVVPQGSPVLVTGTASTNRSEEHTSELQSLAYLVCRLLLEKKKHKNVTSAITYIKH